MRFKKNIEILKFLKSGINLQDYTGFGGLHKNMTQSQKLELQAILGNDLYKDVITSCKTAYYTPVEIINFIYESLTRIGFVGGNILEPSCGHGTFIFNCPDVIKNNSVFYGVELERLSARLSKIICPYAKIQRNAFEKVNFKDNTFDLVIGNPPYSNQVIYSDDVELNNLVVHHFFVAKSIKLLKDNGILAFVLPQYCLDNVKNHARHIMQKYGSIVAAYRLPDNMFDSAKVTVDIIFYIKNKEHYTNFLNTSKVNVKGHSLPINQYFIDNPNHILGELDTCNMYNERIGLTVKNNNKEAVFNKLNSLIKTLPKVINSKAQNTNLFNQINASIEKLSNSNSLLEKRLNDLEIQKLRIFEQELLDIEKKKQTISTMLSKYK